MCSGLCVYLLDANAIRKLNYELIKEKKDKNISIVTISDIEYEVQQKEKVNLLNIKHLSKLAYEKMKEIMNHFETVRKNIDYYENKGVGDIGLLAYSLTANDGQLYNDEIIIVTEDKKLRGACDDLKIKWISVEDFKTI